MRTSEPEDSPLDILIDEAARSLTAAPVPVDLKARVLTRLETAESWWKTRWLVPAAIATACVVLVALYVTSGRGQSTDTSRRADVSKTTTRSNESVPGKDIRPD